MPIYNLNNRKFNIPDEVVNDFERDNPDATIAYNANGNIYDIPVNKKQGFLQKYPNATLYDDVPQINGEVVNNTISGGVGTQEEADSLFELNAARFNEKDPNKRAALDMQYNQLEDSLKEKQGQQLRNHLENSGEIRRLQEVQGKAQLEIDKSSFFDRFFNAETRAAVAARDAAEEALETYSEANQKNDGWFDKNVGGALRGFFDKVGDLRTWDFGASGVSSAVALKDASEKLERGEALTPAEQNMLDAYGLSAAVQAAYQDKVGTAYRVGGSLPESLAFGASLALNPAGGVGKKIAETAAKAAVKKYGTGLVSKLAKGAARVGGDIVEMGVATAIPGAGRVAEDYYNRLNGQSTFDVDNNGIIRYGGQVEQEEADDAIWKAFGSQFIENYSESMGNYFAPMGTMLSNLTSKGLKAGGLGKLAEAVSDISSSQWSKGLQRFKDAVKFDGLVGEYLEEVAGNFMNAATVGDMNFNSPEDPNSVFNPDTNIETFLSCALLSGTMYAVEAPITLYNKHTAKKNLRNADNTASSLLGNRWGDLRNQMDSASPEHLAQILTGVQNAEDLNDEQKQAVKLYASRLMQSQGYNARNVQNAQETTTETNEAQNAYNEGSENDAPQYVFKANRERVKAGNALKAVDENVASVIDAALETGESVEVFINSLDENVAPLARDYYNKSLRMRGVIDGVMDRAEDAIAEEEKIIRSVTDPSTGMYTEINRLVTNPQTGEREAQPGYVVGWIGEGENRMPTFLPEGAENIPENRIPLKPTEFEKESIERLPMDDVISINAEMIRERAKKDLNDKASMAEQVYNYVPKNEDQVIGTDGQVLTITGVTPDGIVYISEQGNVKQMSLDEWKGLMQAQLDAQEQISAEEQAAAPEVVEEVQPTEEADIKENLTTESGNNLSPVEEVAQPQAEVNPQTPVIPTKEDGSIDFVSYGKEGTFKTLGEKYGEKMPNKVAVTAKALAEDLKKAQNKLQKAEEAYDNAPIGREQKAEEARDKAKQELEAIQREANFWAEMDAEIKDAQARRELMLNPQAEVETSTEPMNVDEFVAQQLASGNIVLDKEDYKKETGYGDTEANAMNGGATKLFGKNGMTIQEAGERLMEIDRENGTNFFDQLDSNSGRDALINVLGSVKSRKELNQYIASNRSEQAKKESEGLRNELEKQAMEANYASLEDYVLQMEAAEMENPFLNDRADEIMAIFAEEAAKYEQSLNNTENGQGTENEVVKGNDIILPEEQLDNTGGTEVSEESERIGDGSSEESESTHAATEVELKQEEGETTLQFAERAAEENRRRPLRKRAEEWSKALGVKVHFIEKLDDVDNQTAYIALSKGSKVAGWYEGTTGKVFFYMPNLDDISEVDKTYIHEVVAHKGLREMLGRERFNELCDKVWDMMPDTEKAKFIGYPGVNGNTRAAADEYIAYLSEKENLTPEEKTMWDRVVKALRDIFEAALNSIIGKTKLTDEDISNLIKASYANLKSGAEGGSANAETNRMRAVERLEENVGEVDAEKGDVRFAVRDVLKGEERAQAIKDLMAVTGRSRRTVVKWLKAEESLASVILNEDNVGILDLEADESVPSIWKNSDYPQGTVEFSNICKKRLPFTTIYQRLQKEFPDTLFDAQTLNTIRNTMKEMGEDVACALCFVEDRRQLLGEIGQGFIDAVKGKEVEVNDNQKAALDKLNESGDKYVPNLFDIITLDGMKELRKKHPAVAQAFIEYNNARGMQSGRLFQAYSAYNREILKYNKKKVESINNNGGLRIFSFSDFEAHHLIDLVQVLTDCAAKGIKVQGYTKVPEFAKAVKDTNAKINRSLIPKGVGYVDADYIPKEGEAVSPNVINGKRLLFDTIEGIDMNNPNFFDSTGSKSVGNILVAINDEHARLAMADPFVDYIIGFHTGQSKAILKGKGIDTWVNYKNEQLDKEIVTDEKGNQKMKNAPHHGLNIYTDVLNVAEAEGNPIKTAKQFTERFIEECNKRGWIPRFHRFLNRAKDGRFLYTPGYHKFLIDFKLFDKNGKILPQEAVIPVFDDAFNKQILDEYVKGVKEEMPNEVVYEAVKEAVGLGEGTRFRVEISQEEQSIIDKAKEDGTYMKAPNGESTNLTEKRWAQVRTKAFKTWFGDWEKNPKKSSLMIDENGEPKVFYHGSPSRFNEFISDKMGETGTGYGQGFYFSPEKWFAEGYVGENGGTLYEVFLNLRKPISDSKKTLKKPSIKRFIDEIDKRMMKRDDDGIGILDNWNDVSYYGRNKVLNEATEAVFEYNETDLEIVGDLINTSGSYDIVTEVLRDVLGFDGVLPSNTDKEVIVHHPNQIKSATDNVGTFDEGNNDIRFRISEKGKQIQAEVDKFTSKYNSKPVRIVEAEMDDNELMETLDYAFELEDVKSFMKESKTAAGYFHNLDKIIIFADKTKVERMEEYLFHENIHAAIHHNNFANLVAHFYEYAKNEAVFEKWSKLAHNKEYKQYNSSEEFLAYVVSNAMVARNLDEVAEYLGDKQKKALNKLFNVIGYDYDIRRRSDEQSVNGRTSEETSGESSLEGNELLNAGEGRGTGEGIGKGKSGKVSAAERKSRLNELFNKVADMGLQGVLGNKEYTSLMVDIYKALPEEVRAEIAEYALRLYGGSVAPAVSDYIGPKSKNSIMDKVVTIVREALRKVGFDLDLNANEVRYMAWRSKKPLDRNNMFEVAEDIDMKYRLKVAEYDGTTPDGGGTRFRVVDESPLMRELESAYKAYDKKKIQSAVNNIQEAILDGEPISTGDIDWESVEDYNGESPKLLAAQYIVRAQHNIYLEKDTDQEYIRTGIKSSEYKKQTEKVDEPKVYTTLYKEEQQEYAKQFKDKVLESQERHRKGMWLWNGLMSEDEIKQKYQSLKSEYERLIKTKDYENAADILGNLRAFKYGFRKYIKDADIEMPTSFDLKEGTRFRVSNKLQVRDEYEATIKKGGYQAREAVQDAMLSLRKFQELIEKATGKKIRDFENAWMHENRLSSVVQAEIHDMERKFYKPMMDAVKKLMKAASLEQEQVADYLMLKHGIERNREMAVRKALTDDKGKIDRTRLEQWYQDKRNVRNRAATPHLDTWRKQQEELDNIALLYGADMSRDYSGLTSMFGTDDLADSTQKAYDEVEALENAHPVETESLGKAIKAMTQNTLDKSFESGLMDRKVYDELSKDMYDYYIPLRGFEETTSEEVYAYLDQDRGAFNAPLKRAKGRNSKSDNPIAYLKSIAESGIIQGNRNKMKQSFLNMVINNPSDLVSVREGVWVIYNQASGEWEAASAPAIPNNATPADVEAAMEAWEQQMEQAAQNDPNIKKVSEAADIPYRVVGNRMDQHQVIVKRLGKSYTLTINGNPRLAMAINGLTNPNNTSNDGKVAAFVNNKIGAINRSLAAWYTTRNPDFVASNFMRDTFYTNTIVRAKEGNAYANKFHKNYATVLPKMLGLFRKYENGTLNPADQTEAAFLDFMMNGGETGYSNLKDVEEIKKQISKELNGNRFAKVEALAEKLDILNRAVENTARFAAYLTSREEGRSIAKSIFDAKEISVNFNKKGAGGTFFGMTGQTWFGNLAAMVGASGRALYVFFNAAIQGSTNLMHVMKVNPKGTSAGLAAMFLMGAVIPFLFDDDDEKDYYDLPEHVRRNHLIIPGTNDAWISIPLPIEYRIMYGMGELLTSWRTGHERGSDIGRKMLNLTGQALPLNFLEEGFDAFIPSALSPVWQVYNNRSWTGLPIYKDNEFNKDDPEYTKAYKNVDRGIYEFTKALYNWTFDEENQKERIDLNPAVIEALARGYFGGLATQLSNIGKTAEIVAGEREFDWRSIPIGNRLFKSGDERTKEKRVTNEYFENMEKLDFLQSRERMLKKAEKGVAVPETDKFKAQKDLETMQGTEVYKKYQEFKKQKKVVDKIRKTIKEKGSTPEREKQLMEAQEAANKSVR